MIELSLPYPPSTNRLWRAVNGRNIKSAEYRAWERRCDVDMLDWTGRQPRPRGYIDGPYAMVMEVDRPDRRHRDLSNTLKPVEDAMKGRLFKDDSLAQSITLCWSGRKPGAGARVHITLEAA